jgi:hypothetical protein
MIDDGDIPLMMLPFVGSMESVDNHDGTFTHTFRSDTTFPDLYFSPPKLPKSTAKELLRAIQSFFVDKPSPRRESRRKHNRKVKRG